MQTLNADNRSVGVAILQNSYHPIVIHRDNVGSTALTSTNLRKAEFGSNNDRYGYELAFLIIQRRSPARALARPAPAYVRPPFHRVGALARNAEQT